MENAFLCYRYRFSVYRKTAMLRHEDLRLITGNGKFTADWNFPNQLHAWVLRSDRAHARINTLDTSAALAMPGVKMVVTHADLTAAGFKHLPGGVAAKNADGSELKKALPTPLAVDLVRWVGEPIAVVIADSRAQAQDACEAIAIDFDDLPAAATTSAALAVGATQLHEAAPGNLAFDYQKGDHAAVDAAFAKADLRSRHKVVSQRLLGNPMEPRAVAVAYEPAVDVYTICTPTQGINGMRGGLNTATGVPGDKFVIHAHDVGGSFGLRGNPFAEHLALMVAAKKLGRAVKWVGSRADSMLSDWHGRALVLEGEVALDRSGKILAFRFSDTVDLGAFSSAWGSFIGTGNLSVTMGGVYDVPALAMRSRLVYTNTTPVSAYRGAGRPDIAWIIECLIDQAAVDHGFDKIELRRKNYISKAQMPYTTPVGTKYDCGDFAGVLDDGLRLSDWQGYAARAAASKERGLIRGRGLASYLEASGGGGAPKDQVMVRFAHGVGTLYGVAGPSGQGHETSFCKIVGDATGLPPEMLAFRASDPAIALVGNGTGGSRTLLGIGSSMRMLADKLIEVATPHAAKALGADTVAFANGSFSGSGKTITLAALIKQLGAGADALNCDAGGTFGVTFPNGCHLAEVEIDPTTGVLTVDRYTAVDDLGNVISNTQVRGQVHGGVMQGVGQIIGEHAVYDENAQFLTASFMDYPMPRAGWLGEIGSFDHPVPTATNVLGAKGVGESGCSGSLPAVTNAVLDALRQAGVASFEMPATPARVWRALQAAATQAA